MWWGYSQPLDLLQELKEKDTEHSGSPFEVLIIGSGDARHIIRTLASTHKHERCRINFHVIEPFLEQVARSILLLSTTLEEGLGMQEATRYYLELMGNTLLRPATAKYLAERVQTLVDILTQSAKCPWVNLEKFKHKERDMLESIFKFWEQAARNEIPIGEYWDRKLREVLDVRYDYRDGIFDWDYHMALKPRANISLTLHEYRLATVTYGLVCSPFLANRTIKQLAKDEEANYPLGAQILREEIYMDDILSGGHTIEAARKKQEEAINILLVGGFPLRKWVASDPALLDWLPPNVLAKQPSVPLQAEAAIAVLGIAWQPSEDYFHYRISIEQSTDKPTKHTALSKIAQLFDPLGWIAPVIITAKIFMQSLWLLKTDWDTELPFAESMAWDSWYSSLPILSRLRIPRWTGFTPDATIYELHGFADASTRAFGAALYLRVITAGETRVTLLLAKSKVAPLKTLSIPRLELCAALLLTRVAQHGRDVLKLGDIAIHLWSDSADVLYWLRDYPSRWQTFVANRCSEIITLLPEASWHHVRSAENPADAVSRGLTPADLMESELWWHGPSWLTSTDEPWPLSADTPLPTNPSEIRVTAHVISQDIDREWELLHRYSDLPKLLRVTAYCLRFVKSLLIRASFRDRIQTHLTSYPADTTTEVTASELDHSRLVWIRLTQGVFFAAELPLIQTKRALPKASVLSKLNPCLKDGILRVGGRLKHSLLSPDEKNPIILPHTSRFTNYLIERAHRATLHGGTQLTLNTLRGQYWILRGRQAVKSVIHRCITCLRYAASPQYQQMGNLPPVRVTPARPFQNSGIDYAGPIPIRATPGRGYRTYKGYIAIFVCLSTRAVHLEAVTGYDSDAFIAAFKRFTSRRGHCASLYSDQGTNFVGADAELKRLFNQAAEHGTSVARILATDGTSWHFNPPPAPHFGGIWEAAVKSTKHHLRRILGDQCLTFEETSTLLCQIEACLNSRPLVPLSDDCLDLQPLTPAHFLIGSASFLIPEPRVTDEKIPPLKRWLRLTQMVQSFWDCWAAEYLQHLQRRQKWPNETHPVARGDLVLIRSETTSPTKWPLARVTELHPGDDGLVRVVTLRTAATTLKRPVVKLVLLHQSTTTD